LRVDLVTQHLSSSNTKQAQAIVIKHTKLRVFCACGRSCENYNPHKDAQSNNDEGDCSGTRFYHWGALTGMIGLMEDGLF
jgi:hypothetical protein